MFIKPKITIYALKDPRTDLICYIGQAANPQARLAQHCKELVFNFGGTPKQEWITELYKLGLKPEMKVLKEVRPEIATETEYKMIKQYSDSGSELLNTVANTEGKKVLVRRKSKELLKIFILDTTEQYVGTQLRSDTFYRVYIEWWWKVQSIGNKLTFKEFKICLFELSFIEKLDSSIPMVKKLSGLRR